MDFNERKGVVYERVLEGRKAWGSDVILLRSQKIKK